MGIKLVRLTVKHDWCWTELTASYPNVSVASLGLYIDPQRNHTMDSVLIKSFNAKEFAEFYSDLKSSKWVARVNASRKVRSTRNNFVTFLNFDGVLNGTLTMAVYRNRSPFFTYNAHNGLELWDFIALNADQLKLIKEDMSEVGSVKDVKVMDLDRYSFKKLYSALSSFKLKPLFTDNEISTLNQAFSAGFYKIPRKSKTAMIAKQLNISPSTLNERLRSVEAKLASLLTDGA